MISLVIFFLLLFSIHCRIYTNILHGACFLLLPSNACISIIKPKVISSQFYRSITVYWSEMFYPHLSTVFVIYSVLISSWLVYYVWFFYGYAGIVFMVFCFIVLQFIFGCRSYDVQIAMLMLYRCSMGINGNISQQSVVVYFTEGWNGLHCSQGQRYWWWRQSITSIMSDSSAI